MLTNQTPSKLKCGIPIWENSEEYWYLMLKDFVFPKVLAYWKKKTKCSVESSRDNIQPAIRRPLNFLSRRVKASAGDVRHLGRILGHERQSPSADLSGEREMGQCLATSPAKG